MFFFFGGQGRIIRAVMDEHHSEFRTEKADVAHRSQGRLNDVGEWRQELSDGDGDVQVLLDRRRHIRQQSVDQVLRLVRLRPQLENTIH